MNHTTRLFAVMMLLLWPGQRMLGNESPVSYLGIEQGLSNNAITSIYRDHDGFMWFGTYDGLNRYDGYGFRVFRNVIGDTTSLLSNSVYSIEGGPLNNLWVGGQKGACVYQPSRGSFQVLRFSPLNNRALQYVHDNTHVIKAAGSNTMLVGTQHQGLLVFTGDSFTGRQVSFAESKDIDGHYDVIAIAYDARHKAAWVFVQQAGLCRYDPASGTLTLVNALIRHANTLKVDNRGQLWVGTDNGLYSYHAEQHVFSESLMPVKSRVINMHPDQDNVLWIGTDGAGLWKLASTAPLAEQYLPANGKGINSNAVFAVYVDPMERKWIGTLRGGVNRIEPRNSSFPLVTYTPASVRPNLAGDFIFSFCEDKLHNLWIGTDGAGLRYWDRRNNQFTAYRHDAADPGSVSSNFITGITIDVKENIWVSTWLGGVDRIDKQTGRFIHYECFNPHTGLKENNIWLLFEDAEDRLWASASNEGTLYLFNRQQDRFEVFDESILNLQSLTEDRSGNLWGGDYTSLIRIDRAGKQHQSYEIGYPIRFIHEDRKKNFWIGTQEGGLLLFDRKTGSYIRYTTANGLPSNTTLRILEDRQGNLWLSTFNGLSKFTPQSGACRNFTQSDGLQSNQFSFNAGLALSSGEFVFGGIKGFNIFFPDSVYDQTSHPAIFLTGTRVNNNPIEKEQQLITRRTLDKTGQITLPYDRAVVALDFLALEYTGTDKIQYAYLLDGWDKNWTYVNNTRTANYSRLQEGNYFFKVKITDPGGNWSEATTLLNIVVLPPWYRTWWAYLLYGAFFSGAVYVYIRYTRSRERLRYKIKLSQLENEKDKELMEKKLSFFTHISHEFRTPLSLIINPLKEALRKNEGGSAELRTAHRNSRRLLSLVDQLLLFRKADSGADSLKISRINICNLCKEVFECFTHQARSRNINYQLNTPEDLPDVIADYEKVEIALFNLLSNAFKFTPDHGTIQLSIVDSAEELSISIRDTGCGIPPADCRRIFEKFQQSDSRQANTGFGLGLYLVRHSMESLGGKVVCHSVVNEGSTFIVTLPRDPARFADRLIREDLAAGPPILEELAGAHEINDPVQDASPSAGMGAPLPGKSAEEIVTGKKSILLIDDNPEITRYLEDVFGSKYLIYHAANGTDGFRMARQHSPDLVISDIQMSGMDGLELCSRIKASAELGHIPVILLTGATADEIRLKGIEGGADDYITKPFDQVLLQAKVDTVLKNRNLLQRYFLDSITLKESKVKVPAEYQDFLRTCIGVIEENLDTDDFTIKKFAKAMGMSYPALYNKVKSISGQSLNAFIRSIRLRRAAVLMLTENMNINQAAFQVGIRDIKYFREQFVKLFGLTPSEYIKRYRFSFNRDYNLIPLASK